MGRPTSATAKATRDGEGAVVRPIPVVRDDAALVEGLRSSEPWARAALFDRYAPMVERRIRRLLGPEAQSDLADLIQDVFVQALGSLDRLRDGAALPAWLRTIATRTAYRAIRTRRTRRWLRFWDPQALPEVRVQGIDPEIREAYDRTYAILHRMPAAERLAFSLRHIEKLELADVAEQCDCSLATIKRRLSRAQQRFARAAGRDEILRTWLEEGGRWTS